jgi:hypothetical protein
MSNVVVLRGIPTDLTSAVGHQFVVDCVRAGEGLITDKDILNDKSASPRHRIESARELRQTAIGPGTENTADTGEKFIITINLGADHVEHYEKSIAPMKPLLPTNEVKINDDE